MVVEIGCVVVLLVVVVVRCRLAEVLFVVAVVWGLERQVRAVLQMQAALVEGLVVAELQCCRAEGKVLNLVRRLVVVAAVAVVAERVRWLVVVL
jgi:hypothetical protein